MKKVKIFRLSEYVEAALKHAEYERDEDGGFVAHVPNASGFFSQGDTVEETRENLRDAIEQVVLLALQLGWDVPTFAEVTIEEQDVEALAA